MSFSLLSIALTVLAYEFDAKEEGRAITKHKVLPQEKEKPKDPWQSESPEEREERGVAVEEARVRTSSRSYVTNETIFLSKISISSIS